MQTFSWTLLAVVPLVSRVAAWGADGHMTVGFVAQEFLSPNALAFVKSSLGSEFSESLGVGATWADDVRSEAAFAFSAPFHFIDAEDSPLTGSCSVVPSRDCGSKGCILSAITNYTARVVDTSLSATQRQQALLFVDHFLGDVSQPLHVEALEVGGNDIDAKCGSSNSNLHAVWDTGMIETNLKANFNNNVQTWANSLITRITSGDFESLAAGWISCSSTDASAGCPLVWAKEANAFDCSTVFDFSTGQDLCSGTYFDTAVPIIEMQLAKSGFRLAAWLNVLFDGATNLP